MKWAQRRQFLELASKASFAIAAHLANIDGVLDSVSTPSINVERPGFAVFSQFEKLEDLRLLGTKRNDCGPSQSLQIGDVIMSV